MKRLNNLYEKVCSIENLQLADVKARKGKRNQYGVRLHDMQPEENLLHLQELLINKQYVTSAYKTFKIYEPKEREISCLPYFPDRLGHHAIMNILESMFTAAFTADTFSCIKGRGIHGALKAIKRSLKDIPGTKYCLKLDIKKFYPSIDHDILKQQLRRKLKDRDLLWLLDGIIDSAPGVPIGNYLSQYFANFYLSPFDHWIKEEMKVKYYHRYADDMVIFSDSKEYLHSLLLKISQYLHLKLKLEVKGNYQVFPSEVRGVDVVGYVFRHKYILLRKSTKKSFARMLKRRKNRASIASYKGWAKHCNSKHLLKTLLNDEKI